jgi:molybdenum cofactor biosynthesis enzyme MoaA
VLAGLAEAERYPELRPIKVNCVAVRGFTEEEVPALAELAGEAARAWVTVSRQAMFAGVVSNP